MAPKKSAFTIFAVFAFLLSAGPPAFGQVFENNEEMRYWLIERPAAIFNEKLAEELRNLTLTDIRNFNDDDSLSEDKVPDFMKGAANKTLKEWGENLPIYISIKEKVREWTRDFFNLKIDVEEDPFTKKTEGLKPDIEMKGGEIKKINTSIKLGVTLSLKGTTDIVEMFKPAPYIDVSTKWVKIKFRLYPVQERLVTTINSKEKIFGFDLALKHEIKIRDENEINVLKIEISREAPWMDKIVEDILGPGMLAGSRIKLTGEHNFIRNEYAVILSVATPLW